MDHFHHCRSKVTKMVYRAHYDYINYTIGDRLTEQPNTLEHIRSYIRMICTENVGIPTCRTQTLLCTIDTEKVGTLTERFNSVFTHEPNVNVLEKEQFQFQEIPNHNICRPAV